MQNIDFKQIQENIRSLILKSKFLKDMLLNEVSSVLVVDISSNLKLLNVQLGQDVKVTALAAFELPADDRDEIILDALQNFIKKNNISHRNTALIIPQSSAIIKRLELPVMPDNELAETIKWQIKDSVDFDLAGAILGYQVIKKVVKEDGAEALDIICAAAECEKVKKQVLLLKQAGLNCIAVSLPSFGYARFLEKYPRKIGNGVVGILHLEDDSCYIAFYKEDKLLFYRESPISLNKLRESLAVHLTDTGGGIKLSADEINEILFVGGIPLENSDYKYKIATNQILALLRPGLERMVQEVRRSIIYFNSQFQEGAVSMVLIAGKGIRIPNLDNFLSSELSMNIFVISLEHKITVPSIDEKVFKESYPAFGISLGLKKSLNLLPPEFRTEKIERLEKISLRWVAIVAFLLLLVSYIFSRGVIGGYQKRLGNASVYLEVISQIKAMNEGIGVVNTFINDIKRKNSPLAEILGVLSNVSGNSLFFQSLSINCDSKSGTITGFIRSKDNNYEPVLTVFIDGMKNSRYFKEINTSSIEKTSEGDLSIINFKLTFKTL